MAPIAYIHTDLPEKFGVPRQSGRVKELKGRIVFEKEYRVAEAVRGLDEFSHLWLLWGFSLGTQGVFSPTVRPPRLGGNRRMGVFATRSPNRPNPIGLTVVKLEQISRGKEGAELWVSGIDLVDGTPIYDIKPYIPYADSIPDAAGGFAEEHVCDSIEVDFPENLLVKIPKEKRQPLLGCLGEDPRPSYRKDSRSYGLSYGGFEITFYVDDLGILRVTAVEPGGCR